MNVLAYLLPPPLPDAGSHDATPRILIGGRKTDESDEEHLQRFSDILLGLEKGRLVSRSPPSFVHHETNGKDATFDVLHMMLPLKWDKDGVYDIVNPFGDRRQTHYRALWTFDITDDVLFHTNRDHCSRIPLGVLRERVVALADMDSLGPPLPLPLDPALDQDTPHWKPQAKADGRMRAFTHRLLRDFNHQWRHILRSNYNSTTLRTLARAIIRLSTLDFEVREEAKERHGKRGSCVWITHLPGWDPFRADILRVGKTYVILNQSIQGGLLMAQQHVNFQRSTNPDVSVTMHSTQLPVHYMILSVRHITLCRAAGPNTLECTAPVSLFDGRKPPSDLALDYLTWATAAAGPNTLECTAPVSLFDGRKPPSDLALDYLTWATAAARYSISTPLQSLPFEIQDMILGNVSAGTVAAARIGCLLGLGSPFSWKAGTLNVELMETYTNRTVWTPIESQVWFGEHSSGIVYRGRHADAIMLPEEIEEHRNAEKKYETVPSWKLSVRPLEETLRIPHEDGEVLSSFNDKRASPQLAEKNILCWQPHIHFI